MINQFGGNDSPFIHLSESNVPAMDISQTDQLFSNYHIDECFYDEMFNRDGSPREHCRLLYETLIDLSSADIASMQNRAAQFETLEDRAVEEVDRNWRRIFSSINQVPSGGELQSNLGGED